MSACEFSIPFSKPADEILNKIRSAIQSQGGQFEGDTASGKFSVEVFGNAIAGSYTSSGQTLNITIDEKPFLIPCSAIEGFLSKQLS
ncbi:MAG: hypothetical protein U0T56_01100 [Ferruginibacter sp.]|jgi:hypothetical protein